MTLFSCTDSGLVTLEPETGPFTLLAYNPQKFAGSTVEACGRGFNIQLRGPCTYCPDNVAKQGLCPAGTETVLGGGGMVSDNLPCLSRHIQV
jgi:hypothetical protein